MSKLMLHVTYSVKEGRREEFVSAIKGRGLDKIFRAEKGNLSYEYYYSDSDADSVLLVEKWTDDETLSAHANTEYFKQLTELKNKYVQKVEIEKFDI